MLESIPVCSKSDKSWFVALQLTNGDSLSLSLSVLFSLLVCVCVSSPLNRINKYGSQKDMEQKKNGNYFFYDEDTDGDDEDDDFDDI